MIYRGNTQEYLAIADIKDENLSGLLEEVPHALLVLWFTTDNNCMTIDGQDLCFNRNELICLTEFHRLENVDIVGARLIKFNREFYCIYNHDSEVGCKGLLFFGSQRVPHIYLPEDEIEVFQTVYRMFSLEFQQHDHLQLEMLQMMLKRFLILCARLYKKQEHIEMPAAQLDLIREYNYLVEKHFKEKHNVAEYAELLHRSPKTLSNHFRKFAKKSPLDYIKSRRMLEARRLLLQGDMSIKEVAYELQFEDIQSFSRFFKREEGLSPGAFVQAKGKKGNTSGILA